MHCSELFARPWEFAARRDRPVEIPLWSGLVLQVLVESTGAAASPCAGTQRPLPLRAVEASLIRSAVADAHGNVQEAARVLAISRATVYRKLGRK